MVGYVRQRDAKIAAGLVVYAEDHKAELDALQGAFSSSTGHAHNGAPGEGPPLLAIGPAQQLEVSATAARPKVDNTLDLGSPTNEWKDLYIDGVANIDSLVADTADINAGTIDNTVIGATTPAAGSFSVLNLGGTAFPSVSGLVTLTGAETLTNKTLTAPVITGGIINGGVALAASSTELNILDGATLSTAELNILDGVTATAAEINILDGLTATTAILNSLQNNAQIASGSFSGSELIFDIPSEYTSFELEIWNVVTSASSQLVRMQFGTGTALSPTWSTSFYTFMQMAAIDGTAVTGTGASGSSHVVAQAHNTRTPSLGISRWYGLNAAGKAGGMTWYGGTSGVSDVLISNQLVLHDTSLTRTVARLFIISGTATFKYRITGQRGV